MMKKILPVMIGAALAGGMTAASADVTVFGHIDTAVVHSDTDYDGGEFDGADTNLQCTTCSIGFKGSEDLGNGLKVIFKLDFQYDTSVRNDGDGSSNDGDNDNSGLLDRDQWLGLSGNFGKVRVGTISTVYKSHGAMIDPLYRTAAQGRAMGLQSDFHNGAGDELGARSTSTIRWDSADFNGLKIGAFYTLDHDESDGEDEDPFGIGAQYKNGGILVFADYMDNNQGDSDPDGEVSVWKLGGKYSMNNFAVMGQYEDADLGDDYEMTTWHIAGSFTQGNNMLYLGYGSGELEEGGYDEDYDAFTIAGMHSMSKRTSVYAAYSTADCSYDIYDTPCENTNSDGGDPSVFAVGLKHKF
ncbi:MAG: porin [Gammaproteobacteria bacterium]|nr:porin [Gammaproteobacteria bacterium]